VSGIISGCTYVQGDTDPRDWPLAFVKLVVDTSAIIAVLLGEEGRDRIVDAAEGADLIAPASLHWEIGNAFSAMFKRGRLSAATAIEAAGRYREIPIQFVEVGLPESIRLSDEVGLYAYDAYMIVAARRHRAPLLTLDGGLQEAARKAGVDLIDLD
jgi:predicted nucleic acid-binding protein